MQPQPNNRKRARGFTLIELMVVIVILGILATGAIVMMGGQADDAKYGVAGSHISKLKNDVLQYRLKFGELPASLENLKDLGDPVKLDDPWGRPYEYDKLDEKNFEIASKGVSESDDQDDIFFSSETGEIVNLRDQNLRSSGR